MTEPLISIVMPVRNAGPYLEDCIQSILSQTHAAWELLAVNDHSTDNSLEVLEQFVAADPRIHVFENSGMGIVDALNLAYQNAKGDYISRMDADDMMPPAKLEHLLHTLLGGFDIATGLVNYFHDDQLGDGFIRYAEWLNELTVSGKSFEEIYKECPIASPAWMISKSNLDKAGSIATPDVYPEDYDLVFRWRRMGFKIGSTDTLVHHWRDHDHRASRNDPNYADNSFLDLKLKYFLEDDFDPNKPLVVWGAGPKGKKAAKILIEKGITFRWITNTETKIGKQIYGVTIENEETIQSIPSAQIIILVAQPEGQQVIKAKLKTIDGKAYWFC